MRLAGGARRCTCLVVGERGVWGAMGNEDVPHAEPGCSLLEGPHHKWSVRWYFNIPGCEYMSLYLWLIKVGRG